MTMLFESPASSTRIGGYSELFMRPATATSSVSAGAAGGVGGDSSSTDFQQQHTWPEYQQQQPHHHGHHQQHQSMSVDSMPLYAQTARSSTEHQRPPSTADSTAAAAAAAAAAVARRPGTANASYDTQLSEQLSTSTASGTQQQHVKMEGASATPNWAHQPPAPAGGLLSSMNTSGAPVAGGFSSMDLYQPRPASAEGVPPHYGGRGHVGGSFSGGVAPLHHASADSATSASVAAAAAAAMYGGVGGGAGGYHYRPMSSSSSASSPTMGAQPYGYPPLGYAGPASAGAHFGGGGGGSMAGGGGGPSPGTMYAYPHPAAGGYPSSHSLSHHHSLYDHGMNRPVPYSPFEVKHRRRTTKAQFTVLESAFAKTPKPTAEARKAISEQIGMDLRSVQIWFQNRRAKAKTALKKAQQAADLATTDTSDGGKAPLIGSASSSSSINDPAGSTSSTTTAASGGMTSSSSTSSLSSLPVAVPRRPSMYTSFSSPSEYSHRSSGSSSIGSMVGWPGGSGDLSSSSGGYDASEARKMSDAGYPQGMGQQQPGQGMSPHMMGYGSGAASGGPSQWRPTTVPYHHQQQQPLPQQGGQGEGGSRGFFQPASHQQYPQHGGSGDSNYGIFYPPPPPGGHDVATSGRGGRSSGTGSSGEEDSSRWRS